MIDDTLALVDILADGLLSTEQAALVIGVDASTLRRWRTAEPPEGPPFVPLSERVFKYSKSDLRQWVAARRIAPADKRTAGER